jgi:hypothetical protein
MAEINISGRIIKRSRRLVLRLPKGYCHGILSKERKQVAILNGIWNLSDSFCILPISALKNRFFNLNAGHWATGAETCPMVIAGVK